MHMAGARVKEQGEKAATPDVLMTGIRILLCLTFSPFEIILQWTSLCLTLHPRSCGVSACTRLLEVELLGQRTVNIGTENIFQALGLYFFTSV